MSRWVFSLFNVVQRSPLCPWTLRWVLLRAYGLRIDTRQVSHGCWFGGRDVTVGRGSFVNFGVVFDNMAPIRVGSRCHIAMRASLLTSSHRLGFAEARAGETEGKPIVIGDGCWIGADAKVMPGVTVGPGCVIAAGAVVTRDCEPNGLYAGAPARRVRDLT